MDQVPASLSPCAIWCADAIVPQSYCGGQPPKMEALVAEAVAEHCAGGSGGLARTLLAALAVVGVAAAGGWARLGKARTFCQCTLL